MDFLNAQSDYRAVELAYLQLVGSYLTAAGQLNLAVGREGNSMISNSSLKQWPKTPSAYFLTALFFLVLAGSLALTGCKGKDEGEGAPPPHA